MDMLLLASGFQPSASFAFWRIQDVQRAIGWASLLEQIIAKIPVHKEDNGSRQTLNRALQALMGETLYPEGLPQLSCESLGEAKKLFFFAMTNALGSCNEQIESLVAAVYRDEKDWEVVCQHLRERCMVVESTKSAAKALELAVSMLNRRDNMCGCQQWRQEALSYLLDSRTLYKISGTRVLFKCSEVQWRSALQRIEDQANSDKLVEIAELCCLHMCQHRHSVLITKLMQPCERRSCSTEALKLWQLAHQNMEGLVSKEPDAVEALLHELAQREKGLWWSLPPILVAAALTKGSRLFEQYNAQLSTHLAKDNHAEWIWRCAGEVLEAPSIHKYNLVSRSWCLQFVEDIQGS